MGDRAIYWVQQVIMAYPVWTDMHGDGNFQQYYSKTAGDMVQSFGCRLHLDDMSNCFQTQPIQAAIAKWLQLHRIVLPSTLAERVCEWSERPLADFQEMITLYMPTKLLETYMNVCCNYYRLFCKDNSTHAICRARARFRRAPCPGADLRKRAT